MIFNEDIDEYAMNQKIRDYTNEDSWKDYVIDILIDMPDIEIEIGEWVKKFQVVLRQYVPNMLMKYQQIKT